MPHHVSNPTTIEQAFINTANFLNNETAWDALVYADNEKMRVRIPGAEQDFVFSYVTRSVSSTQYGVLSREDITCDVGGMGGELFTASCDYIAPISRLFVHAGVDPEPWALMTFETAPGYFHHLYFGYVEKLGQYDSGVVASGFVTNTAYRGQTGFNDWRESASSTSTTGYSHFLFGAGPGIATAELNRNGGMEIVSPEAPATVYRFGGYTTSGGYYVGGGFTHGHNGLLMATESSTIDGSINAHPVVLHAQVTGNLWQTPVAVIPGVRMINITDLEPAQVITLGGEFWQVFPLCNKTIPRGASFVPVQGEGPGRFTPGTSATNFYNMGGATEWLGVAVRREP